MTNKNRNNNRSGREKMLFDQFPDEQKDLIKKLWEKSFRAKPVFSKITEKETEQALGKVHDRIGKKPSTTSNTQIWKWVATAAMILIIFGAGLLLIHKTVTVPYGETATVELPDGSTVDLNSGSEIQYNQLYSFTNRKIYLDGEAFFSVETGDVPFLVTANHATVKVTGTKFNVRAWSEEPGTKTEVVVSEGTVQFYNLENPDSSVTIKSGQLSLVSSDLAVPTVPEPVAIDRVVGWRNNKLIFNDKTLGVIFSELERRFDVKIELQTDKAADESLTTYYAEPKDIETILEDICRVKGLRYARTANGYRVY